MYKTFTLKYHVLIKTICYIFLEIHAVLFHDYVVAMKCVYFQSIFVFVFSQTIMCACFLRIYAVMYAIFLHSSEDSSFILYELRNSAISVKYQSVFLQKGSKDGCNIICWYMKYRILKLKWVIGQAQSSLVLTTNPFNSFFFQLGNRTLNHRTVPELTEMTS